jgi:hypothetical protein
MRVSDNVAQNLKASLFKMHDNATVSKFAAIDLIDLIDDLADARKRITDLEAVGNDPLESFRVLWNTYALEDDANLEAKALELKRELRSIVGVDKLDEVIRQKDEALRFVQHQLNENDLSLDDEPRPLFVMIHNTITEALALTPDTVTENATITAMREALEFYADSKNLNAYAFTDMDWGSPRFGTHYVRPSISDKAKEALASGAGKVD